MSDLAQADRPDLSNSIGDFAELVAEGTPTPGGGSVAAHCGMLAASLGQMVCTITIGKPKYAAAEARLKGIRSELERLSARLRVLIAEDAESFERVLRAYRLSKDNDAQKSMRAAQIQRALQQAVDVPFETARRSLDVLKLLRELADSGTPNALADVAVGAQLAQVAVRGASYNVGVNLDSITDREATHKPREQMAAMIEQSKTIAGEIESKLKTQ
jgi:formiminotetrahydrofolate cyclodeaminase